MREDYGALGLPDETIPAPLGAQIKIDLKREGTLTWMLREMVDEIEGYERNILAASVTEPDSMLKLVDWQARRQVLVQWLEKMVAILQEQENGN